MAGQSTEQIFGHITAVSAAQATVTHDPSALEEAVRVGSTVRIMSAGCDVVGTVKAIQTEAGPPSRYSLVVDLWGEIWPADGGRRFNRGVSRHPIPGAPVAAASAADLAVIYAPPAGRSLRVGTLYEHNAGPAFLPMNALLSRHFAVIGSTGSGKSCGVTVILSAILEEHPDAHIILLDPHNEYSEVFGERAEVLNVDNFQMPLWMLDYAETSALLVRGGTQREQEAQAIILKDAMFRARRSFLWEGLPAGSITVDTPVPYRLSDLLSVIHTAMGTLERADSPTPYLRLRTRIESLRDDRRFAFMFSDRVVPWDTLPQFIGQLLHIPPHGKPMTILDLSGVPAEVVDVVVSSFGRLLTDFVQWSGFGRVPPILLVCEEAHRCVPAANGSTDANSATRAIMRIAREGRKYGISLGLVSQRPSELSPQALSQCGTLFVMRLANEADQDIVARALPDAGRDIVATLPNLGTREAIVVGDAAPFPMRIRFSDLPDGHRPRSEDADFSKAWGVDAPPELADPKLVEEGVRRWRMQVRSTGKEGFG